MIQNFQTCNLFKSRFSREIERFINLIELKININLRWMLRRQFQWKNLKFLYEYYIYI